METIFIYILKVNVLIALFYLVYQVALSRETFYKHSRWFLLSGLLVSIVLPFVTFTKVEYYEVKQVLSNSIENNVPEMAQLSQEATPMLTNQEILFLVYGGICFGFFIKTLFDFFKLFKIIRVSNSQKKDKLVYINTNLVHTPFSFFNYIVFNEELINPIELQNIMKHEEAHSRQKHSFDTLLAQFFVILFWFNPIVWLYRKSIVQNLEFLADSYAIAQVSDKKQYQKTMLKITTQSSNITIINTFNQSSIKKRIIMLNTNQSNRKSIWKFGIILPFVTTFMLLFQVETIAQVKESKTIKKEIKQAKIEIEKAKPVIENAKKEIEITKKEIEQAKIEIESANSDNERTRKEIELAKIEVKNEMKNASPEVKRARIEMERAKKENTSISEQDVAPEPQDGIQEFRKYIAKNFKLPVVDKAVTAMVVAKFIVTKTGEISDVTILSESPKDLGLNEELIRVLKESPKWKPGTKDGKPADLYYVLPVAIQIESAK